MKKRTLLALTLAAGAMAFSTAAYAGEHHHGHKKYDGMAQHEKMKEGKHNCMKKYSKDDKHMYKEKYKHHKKPYADKSSDLPHEKNSRYNQ
ncbi:MAG: hypothetical protein ACLFP8_03205 [Alphaproteobacteria bacterium]